MFKIDAVHNVYSIKISIIHTKHRVKIILVQLKKKVDDDGWYNGYNTVIIRESFETLLD